MSKRLLISILALLVVLAGGFGYYSFTLNRQVDRLSESVTAYQAEQTARIEAVSSEVGSLRAQTQNSVDSLNSQVSGARSDIASLNTGLSAAADRITGAEEKIGGVSAQVATLDERVAGTESSLTGLSKSVIDAGAVYQRAVRATVRITNGQSTAGSGFIYDAEGRVVTAYHVVNGLSPIYIMMYDGRVSRATVTGYCPFSDVAVLQLENNPSIEPLPLGDSSLINIGEPVIAIGSPGDSDEPLGLRDTLTSGVISQVNRFVNIEGNYIANLLQFDTAVNFGNSGCPLIDAKGQVVGVVNARIDPTLGDGIYWAIDSNKVKHVVEAIISQGSFAYPWIGVGVTDLTPQYATEKSLATTDGALVGSVFSSGPAQTAGILVGDIIISIDDLAARNIADLTSYLGEYKSPGDTAVIEVVRGADHLKISVIVGTRPE
jgi:S1-C subfamily serine protease